MSLSLAGALLPVSLTGFQDTRHQDVHHPKQPSLLLPVNEWLADSACPSCCCCQAQFGFLRRKHHCRFCGLIFCNQCCCDDILFHRCCSACYQIASAHFPFGWEACLQALAAHRTNVTSAGKDLQTRSESRVAFAAETISNAPPSLSNPETQPQPHHQLQSQPPPQNALESMRLLLRSLFNASEKYEKEAVQATVSDQLGLHPSRQDRRFASSRGFKRQLAKWKQTTEPSRKVLRAAISRNNSFSHLPMITECHSDEECSPRKKQPSAKTMPRSISCKSFFDFHCPHSSGSEDEVQSPEHSGCFAKDIPLDSFQPLGPFSHSVGLQPKSPTKHSESSSQRSASTIISQLAVGGSQHSRTAGDDIWLALSSPGSTAPSNSKSGSGEFPVAEVAGVCLLAAS